VTADAVNAGSGTVLLLSSTSVPATCVHAKVMDWSSGSNEPRPSSVAGALAFTVYAGPASATGALLITVIVTSMGGCMSCMLLISSPPPIPITHMPNGYALNVGSV
jgi:hypothetical protein